MEAARRRHGNDVTTTTCLLLDSDYSQWPPWLDVLLGMYFTYCTMTTFTAHRSCVKKSYAIVLALMLFNAHVGPSNCCAASLGSLSHHAQDHSTPTAGRTHDSSIDREPRRLQAHGGQEGWLTSIQVVLMISSVVMISPVATMTTEVSPQPEHSNAIRILLIGAATIAVAVFVFLAANMIRKAAGLCLPKIPDKTSGRTEVGTLLTDTSGAAACDKTTTSVTIEHLDHRKDAEKENDDSH
eukprot:GHVS01090424.1.p1 GENE.GHVS01090424.1~~GHVS01090424.1.p1  ORF type:complete len:240 (-),score=26.18 GHVS01090424.1:174-893(-)